MEKKELNVRDLSQEELKSILGGPQAMVHAQNVVVIT